MYEKGLSRRLILKELKMKLGEDFTHESGRILGSMTCKPHHFAEQVYKQNLVKNLGDPGLFPGAAKLEREVIQMLGSLLFHPEATGHIVSGGTEANILAMWAARNLFKNRREVILPTSAHVSFEKAANLLDLKLIKIKLNKEFQVDIKAVKKAITPRTMAIIGIAGTTELGVVDPIPELSEIALAHNVYFHVDAAFGGFVLPFLKALGYNCTDFDFRVPGVCSITIDPHKMGLAPIPAGGILFKDTSMLKAISVNISYMSGGAIEQSTIIGTRSGASSIAVWALLKYLGKEGYKEIIHRCMKLTWKLADEINRINGVSLVTQPTMNIVGIRSEVLETQLIANELRRKRWAVALFPEHIRIAVMPHIKSSHIKNFLEDLRMTVKSLMSQA